MSVSSIRAFSDPKYDYYELNGSLGCLPDGAVFYHDPDDQTCGGVASGCLKLCWRPDGSCYHYVGGAVILPYDFVNTSMFSKAEFDFGKHLKPGTYTVYVLRDGTFEIKANGSNLNFDFDLNNANT